MAFEVAVLGEDLVLQRAMTVPGLPLLMRDELHVRADRCGVALRRALTAYRASRAATDGPSDTSDRAPPSAPRRPAGRMTDRSTS